VSNQSLLTIQSLFSLTQHTGLLNINAVEVNSSVDVYNVIGEKVYTNSLVKGNNSVDLSGLSNGAYFVKLNSNGAITTKKVVLSK
jgi:hypothetical protein